MMPEKDARIALVAVADEMTADFYEVIDRWAERLGVGTPLGVPESDVKGALEATFRDAMDSGDLIDEEDA